jgi:hypothetical protein
MANPHLKPRKKHPRPTEKDGGGRYYFLDEFVKKQGGNVTANQPPDLLNHDCTVTEIAGSPFRHAPNPTDPGYHLDRYARLLMDRIRDYNRALYRMRRAYFYKVHQKEMTKLPDDQLDFPFPLTDAQFDKIEDAYIAAFDCLAHLLNLPLENEDDPLNDAPLYVSGDVECIRRNDYIFSVRIGATASNAPLVEKEIPYSSSSHISISSTFSSYSSSNSWQAQP